LSPNEEEGPASIRSEQRLQLLCNRLYGLKGERELLDRQLREVDKELAELNSYLGISDAVEGALTQMSERLLGNMARIIEEQLTVALQEVLEQPINLRIDREFKYGSMSMQFYIERDGHREDIMKGQGGSVANVLSTGLRLFALTTLDEREHRRFLVLDEQDCWLRPDYVPRFARIVHDAGKALGFQILIISHHGSEAFEGLADKILHFTPSPDGVKVTELAAAAPVRDAAL
jgi:hypothetical protein